MFNLLPGTELKPVGFNKPQQKEEAFFQKNLRRALVSPMFPSFRYGKYYFHCQFLFPRCKLCLRYTAGNFNENPSIRAVAKTLRARASEQFEQRPNFARTFKLDESILYPSYDSLQAWVLSTPCANISTSLTKTICSMEGIIDNKNWQIEDRRDKLKAANYIWKKQVEHSILSANYIESDCGMNFVEETRVIDRIVSRTWIMQGRDNAFTVYWVIIRWHLFHWLSCIRSMEFIWYAVAYAIALQSVWSRSPYVEVPYLLCKQAWYWMKSR